MFSLEIKVHPFESQKDRRVLLTFLTLRSKSSFLTIRLDTANFDNGDSRSINLAKFTIFSPSCLGSSVERLFVPMCSMISSGDRRKKNFTKSDISSTVGAAKRLGDNVFLLGKFSALYIMSHRVSKDDNRLLFTGICSVA